MSIIEAIFSPWAWFKIALQTILLRVAPLLAVATAIPAGLAYAVDVFVGIDNLTEHVLNMSAELNMAAWPSIIGQANSIFPVTEAVIYLGLLLHLKVLCFVLRITLKILVKALPFLF